MSQFRFTRPDQFPPVIKNLIIINALVFVAQVTFGANNPWITDTFALHEARSDYFMPHQLLTYMFLHGGVAHLLFNMLALWMFGSTLENYWGSKRFLQFYIICGLGAALLHLGVLYLEMNSIYEQLNRLTAEQKAYVMQANPNIEGALNAATIGASGSVFGCLAAFGWLFPNSVILLYFMFPIKAKWFVIIYGALELYMGIQNSAGDTVAHFAHLGGAVTAIIIILIWNKTNRRTLY